MTCTDSLNDPDLLAVRNEWMQRFDDLCEGRDTNGPLALSGVWGEASISPLDDPGRCIVEQLDSLAETRDVLHDEEVFRPLIAGVSLYGVHFVDALFNAKVFDLDGTGNWQVEYLDAPVGGLEPPDWPTHPAWRQAETAARAFMESGAALPYFCTPCLSSALNVALNLYGQGFLLALYENPDGARHDLEVITNLIVDLHRWYRAHIPAEQLQAVAAGTRTRPPSMGHICGCSTQLISEEHYREFIVPCEEAVLGVYPRGGMIHLCGAHAHLIPVWREMECIRIVQVNDRASLELAQHLEGLRDDQIIYSHECPDMPWHNAIEITDGRRLVLTSGPNDDAMSAFRTWKRGQQ